MTTTSASRPWYYEPWTWVLIGLPASAVIASLASAWLAIDGADPIIESNYYQRGLDINTTLAQVQQAASLGIHASVEFDGLRPGETVWVRVRSAQPVRDTALRVRLVHPARGGADREAILARMPNSPDTEAEFTGQWPDYASAEGAALGARPVAWRLDLQGQDWLIEGEIANRHDLTAR
jgi:hypothetical protein